ncbi:2-hydroxyacyl-CoA dehydratase [Sphingomonas gilva]|uniref:2-hydroxyacyl-CoA dehydratase n=1 Tax=Sphingomonas gilva TaxID=2305907 RepID=A0A396RXQ5_9SPHN|nr:2-hydroxyacyl-CoA dehydratase family protein [Sphingomonas gilva]RHW19253.1 2-hydroxyacyl-CoA dehydratase [Sphingomonas gilva]
MSALALLRAAAADPEAAARAHKAAGGRVIAFLCDNVPSELIAAAGAFPLRLHGRPAMRTRAAERLIDTLYPPDVTQRPPFVASMLDMLIDRVVDFVDAVIVPHNRNAVQAIHRELNDAAAEHGIGVPRTWYLDKAWSPDAAGRAYDRAAILGLHERLEAFAGRAIPDADLAAAIVDGNAARAMVGRISALRGAEIQGSDALQLIAAFWALPHARFAELAAAALGELAPPPPGPRLYLGGSPQDHTGLYTLVERLGATIVTEDHCWGVRAADGMLPADVAPLDAIAARFQDFPACSIRFPLQRTIDANLARARAARVDAAIFAVADRDSTQAWETPEQVAAFRGAGIPTLHLRRQPYEPDGAATDLIGAFLQGLPR